MQKGEKESDHSAMDKKLEEAVRFSLLTLLGIADSIKQAGPKPQEKKEIDVPDNILDPQYRRPWWPALLGLGGLYLGYRLFKHGED